jgi:hypothetical protein
MLRSVRADIRRCCAKLIAQNLRQWKGAGPIASSRLDQHLDATPIYIMQRTQARKLGVRGQKRQAAEPGKGAPGAVERGAALRFLVLGGLIVFHSK